MDPLLTLSATQIAARIRRGELSSIEAVNAFIGRIEAVNPKLNLMVRDRFATARAEAATADARLAADGPDDLPPLHGVPTSNKESIGLKGMPFTTGLVARDGITADKDAVAVARLRAAGTIPLGVTNTSELCMWMESHNKLYGRSRNPYDPSRTVGGSSGGEAALVSACGAPVGLGSDVGGSIRMPAFFNGIFGHKPTGGLVPSTGQYPPAEGVMLRYVTTGPLCRRAEDIWPMLKILAGPDPGDSGSREVTLGDPDRVELEGLPVLSVADNGVTPVSRDLRDAQRRVANYLAASGAKVTHLKVGRGRLAGLKKSLFIWSSMLSASEGEAYSVLLGNGRCLSARELVWEGVRQLWGASPYTIPSIGLGLLERLPKLLPDNSATFIQQGQDLKRELGERIGDGVLLYPSYASPAPRHNMALLPPTHWVYTSIMNVMELPCTQTPLGLNAKGLPLGVQVLGAHDNDHVTVAVARALEQAFGGWVPPPA